MGLLSSLGGLLGGGGDSDSSGPFSNTDKTYNQRKYDTTNTTYQKTQSQQVKGGAAVAGTGNTVSVTKSSLAPEVAKAALGANANVVQNALAETQNTVGDALDFGRDALDAERAAQAAANGFALDALNIGVDASQNALSEYTDQVDKLVRRTSTNTDARLQKITQELLIAAAAMVVLPKLFKVWAK